MSPLDRIGLCETVVIRVERGDGRPRCVAFDLDGVLVDTDELHYVALNMALRRFGAHISATEHFARYKGLPTRVKCRMLTEAGQLPADAHERVFTDKQQHTATAIGLTVHPAPEKLALLERLASDGWRLCVCSNAIRDTVMALVEALGATRFLDFFLSNEDVDIPKPSPGMYVEAARRFGIPPADLVVVEDAPPGVAAAVAAGCRVVRVGGPSDVDVSLLERIRNGMPEGQR